MTKWLTLPQVAAGTASAERPIAWRGGELLRRSRFLADVVAWRARFVTHGGRRYALYDDDSYRFAAALWGAWHAGVEVFLPADMQLATVARLRAEVDAFACDLPSCTEAGPAQALQPLDPHAARLVVHTSGSSGDPVAISKSLAQLDAEVRHLQDAFGAGLDGAAVLGTVSHQHIYGLLFCVLWPLAAGRPYIARRLEHPEEIAASPHEACVLVASPAHLKRLPKDIDWSTARCAVRAVFSSGGPLPAEAADAALSLLGRSPIEVYGSSETGGIAWRQRAWHGETWRALPGVQWRIDGELLAVRSPHQPADDWWTTSDLAEPVEGGFVLRGRADRIVKVQEKRVSLTALDRALEARGEVQEARVIPLPDDRLGAVVVLSAEGWQVLAHIGKRALNERLRMALLDHVERVALPRRWRYVRALPFNAQGKATQAALAALFRPTVPAAQWVLREASSAVVQLDVSDELAVFDGHFPGQPILPGVAQVDWAIGLARECFALPPRFHRLDALKFQQPVRPGALLELSLQWQADGCVLGFRYSSVHGVHASGRIVFEADGV
jgi:acyl-CoA synthetase (AMP-forming)/AMP-acid ligase II/3-hydroxymyristoyl/3-hydroxydecanoyl-(acyl carrier protein) dehydratase